jgi:hypothetical protein
MIPAAQTWAFPYIYYPRHMTKIQSLTNLVNTYILRVVLERTDKNRFRPTANCVCPLLKNQIGRIAKPKKRAKIMALK